MIADSERREVARRLRDEVGSGSSWPGIERLGLILGIKREPRTGWEGRILTRLADLIEPSDHIGDSDKMVDRDALLALADELEGEGLDGWASGPVNVGEYARRIREALGVET